MARVGANGIGRDHRAAANFAFASALLFVLAALLYVDAFSIETHARTTAPGGMDGYKSLNATNLQFRWAARRQAQGPLLFAEFAGAVAWFSLMPSVSAMTALLGGDTRSATSVVQSSFHAVALITLVHMTFQAGTITLVDWVSTWPIVRDASEAHAHDGGFGALQALEIAWLVGRAPTVWLFTMDELLLAVALFTTAHLVYTSRGQDQPLHSGFAHLAVVGGLVNVIGFGLHIAREFAWTKMVVPATMSSVLVYLFILPTWLVWLGVQLRGRSEAVSYASAVAGGAGKDVEMASSTPQRGPVGGPITADDPVVDIPLS